jgi:hypothetical protein
MLVGPIAVLQFTSRTKNAEFHRNWDRTEGPYGANSLIMLDGAAMSCFVCHYHMKSLSRGVLATKPTLNHLLRFVSLILGFFLHRL